MQKSRVASHHTRGVCLAAFLAVAVAATSTATGACQQQPSGESADQAAPERRKPEKPVNEPGVPAAPEPGPAARPDESAKSAAVANAPQPQPPAPPEHEAPRPSVQRTREMMGTVVQMTVMDVPEAQAGPVLDAAMAEMQRLENVLSEWKPDSEVSQINQAAGLHPVKVSQDLLENVRVGLEVARWSDGAFDISWAALRGLYLFQPGNERVPTDEELRERLPLVNYKNIVLDEKAKTVFLRKKGMMLGLGGIAKGYALEKAANILKQAGFKSFMFFGGGQVVVEGKKGNRPWRVGVQHPRLDDYFGFVEAEHGSIATSGDYEHAFIRDGQRWHHIIDLKTGRPVQHTAAVTVISDSPFYADAIDTALFIMGPKKAFEKLATAPGPKADLLLIDKDMRLHLSPGMKDRLILRVKLSDDGIIPTPAEALQPPSPAPGKTKNVSVPKSNPVNSHTAQ